MGTVKAIEKKSSERSVTPPNGYSSGIRLSVILLLFILLSSSFKSQHKKDSLWAIWSDITKLDTVRLNALDKSCETYFSVMPDTVIAYTHLTYDFSKKINHKRGMMQALMFRAGTYLTKGDYEKSLAYYWQALALNREINYENGINKCFLGIGAIYNNLGDEKTAVKYYYAALKGFTKNKETRKAIALSNKECTAIVLTNLAVIYNSTGQADSALTLIKKAIDVYTKLNDETSKHKIKTFALHAALNNKMRMVKALNVMGTIYYSINSFDEAITCHKKAVALCNDPNLRRHLANSYTCLAQACLKKKNYAEAKDAAIKGLEINRSLKDSLSMGQTITILGMIAHDLGDLKTAIELGEESFNFQKNVPLDVKANQAVIMAMWYSENKDLKKAEEMYDFYFKNRGAANSDKTKEELFRNQVKYDFEKKQLVAKAELEKKLNALRFEAKQKDTRKNIWLISTSFVLILCLLSAWFLYRNFKQKNTIAAQKNNILKQQLLVSQMNPHFIFNSLSAIQNFIFKQDSFNAGIYLNKFSVLVRMILDFSRKDLISLDEECNFLENYLELQKLRFDDKLNYELKIDPSLKRNAVMIPPMLAQPFIENAIEHGIFYKTGEGFLSIKITLKDNFLFYEIEDDGIGLKESLSLKDGSAQKHSSLAIHITRERIETMNIQNNTDFEIEIKDKGLFRKESSGVYVKFATPYLIL